MTREASGWGGRPKEDQRSGQEKSPGLLFSALFFGYSPRVVTMPLSAIALPLLVARLGANEYGRYATVIALTSLLLIFGEGGVSYAMAKVVAETRPTSVGAVRALIGKWAVAQAVVAVAGFALSVGGGAIGIVVFRKADLSLWLVLLASVSGTLGTAGLFARSILRGMLSFGRLSVVDTSESVIRNLGWIVVAIVAPRAAWVLLAEIVAVAFSLAVGCFLVAKAVGADAPRPGDDRTVTLSKLAAVWRESSSFLLLRFATLATTQGPVLIFSRILGNAAAGVLGAFWRFQDIVNGPPLIVGQAIGAKAAELVSSGEEAARRLWGQMWRLSATWLAVIGTLLMLSPLGVRIVFRDYTVQWPALALLSVMMGMHVFAAVFATQIDYLGHAADRARVLVVAVLAYVPLLMLGARVGGLVGGVGALAGAYTCLVAAYMLLSRKVLRTPPLGPPRDVLLFAAALAAALLLGWSVGQVARAVLPEPDISGPLAGAAAVLATVLLAAVTVPSVRRRFTVRALLSL